MARDSLTLPSLPPSTHPPSIPVIHPPTCPFRGTRNGCTDSLLAEGSICQGKLLCSLAHGK